MGGQEGEGQTAIKTYRESGEEEKDNLALEQGDLFIEPVCDENARTISVRSPGSLGQGSKRLGNGHPIRIQMRRPRVWNIPDSWNRPEVGQSGTVGACQVQATEQYDLSFKFPAKIDLGSRVELRRSPRHAFLRRFSPIYALALGGAKHRICQLTNSLEPLPSKMAFGPLQYASAIQNGRIKGRSTSLAPFFANVEHCVPFVFQSWKKTSLAPSQGRRLFDWKGPARF